MDVGVRVPPLALRRFPSHSSQAPTPTELGACALEKRSSENAAFRSASMQIDADCDNTRQTARHQYGHLCLSAGSSCSRVGLHARARELALKVPNVVAGSTDVDRVVLIDADIRSSDQPCNRLTAPRCRHPASAWYLCVLYRSCGTALLPGSAETQAVRDARNTAVHGVFTSAEYFDLTGLAQWGGTMFW